MAALSPGTRLGPFEVLSVLGVGGMGEVYRAHDTSLGREVALKVLPETVSRTPERLARFEREARLLAALNHTHIGAIYGIQDSGPLRALVLELVEGQTLDETIAEFSRRGHTMPVEDALAVARQIAAALDAAHEKGIIHRDLKPSNVKIRPDGVVKVLDFGLGRGGGSSESGVAHAPTITSDATVPGVVLGTAAYMSPEQARGSAVDKRTDIWAFGCVLFEMLTGVSAFGGESISDSIARVIRGEPDWPRLPADVPAHIGRLLRRCLQKDAARRLRDIADAELETELESDDRPRARTSLRAADVRLDRLTDSIGMAGAPAISPDGKMVAYVAVTGGRRQVWIRLLAGGQALQVTRDDADHEEPRWLPDSSAIVYYVPSTKTAGGVLWQIAALGGPPRRIAAAIGGADVSHDGRRLAFFQRTASGVALVTHSLDRGTSEPVLDLPTTHQYITPRWSPDDRQLSFQRAGLLLEASLDVVRLADRQQRTIVKAVLLRGHAWLPDGSAIVYSASRGSTMAYPPTNNLRLVGADGRGDRALTFGDIGYHDPHVDRLGRIATTRVRGRSDMWRFSIEGSPADNVKTAVQITRQSGRVQAPALSPDGRELVYISDLGGHSNLWLMSLETGDTRQLTFETDRDVAIGIPVWAPDGTRLANVNVQNGRIDLQVTGTDGSGVTTVAANAFSPHWAPDGRTLYCNTGINEIQRLDVETGALTPVRSDGAAAVVMPDGSGIYFTGMPDNPFGTGGECTIRRAVPPEGPAETLAHVPFTRVPLAPRIHLHVSLSPDGQWLALPLLDTTTANIWLVPTSGGPMRPVTDFGERSVFMSRWIAWAPDSRHVYAAVEETVSDVTLLTGLLE